MLGKPTLRGNKKLKAENLGEEKLNSSGNVR
jgi:hypothetical protein